MKFTFLGMWDSEKHGKRKPMTNEEIDQAIADGKFRPLTEEEKEYATYCAFGRQTVGKAG